MGVLQKPLITEKMSTLGDTQNQYGFKVDLKATKPQIKAEVEKMYGVEVESVRTMIVHGKRKSRFTKTGIVNGKNSNFKKAIVKLKEDQRIDFYENI
jgi:large subunit ribosomal protein L23